LALSRPVASPPELVSTDWLSVLRLSRLFCEDDACPLSPQGDWGHPPISAPGCPSLDLALSPLPALFYLESVSTLGLGLGPTARV